MPILYVTPKMKCDVPWNLGVVSQALGTSPQYSSRLPILELRNETEVLSWPSFNIHSNKAGNT